MKLSLKQNCLSGGNVNERAFLKECIREQVFALQQGHYVNPYVHSNSQLINKNYFAIYIL